MTQEQVTEMGRIIAESALEFLAKKHGVTTRMVADEMLKGNLKLVNQFAELCKLSLEAAVELKAEGHILAA